MTEARSKRRWLRRVLFGIGGLTTLAGIVVAAGLVYLSTDGGREWARNQIEAQLRSALVGGGTIGRIDGSILGSITIHDLVINDADGHPAIRIERADIEHKLLPLLAKRLRLARVHVDGLELQVRINSGGQVNLAKLATDTDDASDRGDFEVLVDELTVAQSKVVVVRAGAAAETLEQLTVAATRLFLAGGDIDIRLGETSARHIERNLEVGVAGNAAIEGGSLALSGVDARLADAQLSLESAQLATDDVVKINGSLTIPATAVTTVVGLDEWIGATSLRFNSDGPAIVFSGTIASTTLAGEIEVAPSLDDATINLSASSIDLSRLWRGLPESQLDVDVKGGGGTSVVAGSVRASGEVLGKRLDAFKAEIEFADEKLAVTASVDGEKSTASLVASVELAPRVRIEEGKLTASSSDLSRVASPWLDLKGDLEATLLAAGPLESLAISGNLTSKRLRSRGVEVEKLVVEPRITRHGQLAVGDVAASASMISLGGEQITAVRTNVETSDARTAKVRVSGKSRGATLALEADITRRESDIAARLARVNGRYRQLEVQSGSGIITWRAQPEELDVGGLRLRTNAGEIEVARASLAMDGTIVGPTSLALRRIELGLVSKVADLEQRIQGTASLEAELLPRRGGPSTITIGGNDIELPGDLPAIRGTVTASLRGRELAVNGDVALGQAGSLNLVAAVKSPRRPMVVAGWAGLDAASLLALNATLQLNDAAAIRHLDQRLPASGSFEVTASQARGSTELALELRGREILAGDLVEPAQLDATVRVDGRTLVGSGTASVSGRADATFDAAAQLAGHWSNASSYQALSLKALEAANASVRAIDIDWWARQHAPALRPSGAVGSAALSYVPTTDALSFRADVALPVGGPTNRALGHKTSVSGTVSARKTVFDLVGAFANAERVHANGELALGWQDVSSGEPDILRANAKANVRIKKLPLLALREVARTTPLQSDVAIAGTLSGRASLRGSLAAPEIEASAGLDGAVIADVAFLKVLAAGNLRNGRVDFTATGEQAGGGQLVLRAASDVTKSSSAPLDAKVVAVAFDLGFIGKLLPERAIDGILSADITAGGTRAKPTVLGSAQIKEGSFNPGAPFHTLRDAALSATLKKSSISIAASATSGRGRVQLESEVALRNNRPEAVTAKLSTKRMPLTADTMMLRIDSEIDARGKLDGQVWKLNADIKQATVHVPDGQQRNLHPTELPGDIVFASELAKTSKEEASRARTRLQSVIEFALAVRANDSILVRGSQANALVGLSLDVSSGQTLQISGTVRADQGWVEIFGRRYNMRIAEAGFSGDVDPSLNITLAHEFQTMTLFIDVSGRASEPRIEFRSDPAQYDEAELLAFVLGASPDEPDGPGQGIAAQATGAATSLLAGRLANIVTDITPIDVLRIDTDNTSAQRVALGKWITDKLLVAYRHRFTADPDENTGEVTFEYRFLKRWLLEGYVGQEQSGADVLWIRRY